ncbi:valine--tRNA ligase [Ruegeria pomeroyi]|uniref:Valine--tRNA ligase n=1 Tax=Ruegeria pomeroyi (strain ATCC 700808 / DSM 15171 / DSS-3) TaxID=246200 RepID=SYV_RUEPO|nr:valine--tRNA ligase [Ruegeria pomeroyi]Q5LP30.1 RecName: Full=Valine--tRNA ligase; AltName: Full=Valyl-tRNA synthetase; Short=ValRS [Ruegeria pomeroyi DSS-3]AAV96258.1 valine--tRNA ligase [Ruegeria pomeroyi DSS-3]NVL02328.1 valine--tRNA ligase [Ruegeria pomeroyi]QWV09808.1 valine--tRNA ligase [Ruegeria pomeroyi]
MAMEKTFDAAEAEARITKAWEEAGAFKAGANRSRDESFTIMIPPPNVTGALHVGHAFNNTLQDILTRWHRMRGFDTLWQPGQDHAGIATQMQVEKMLAATQQPSRRELGREEFLKKVWEWKGQYGGTIVEQLKRLGASCDWSRNAFTMAGAAGDPRTGHENSPNFHDAVIKVFVDMYNKGLIYRGKRLVNWDPHFETAISDLEVENIEVAGHMWHFKYPLAGGATYTYVEKDEDGNIVLEEERDYISIATTRPETMLGDGAVAVHPSDERYAPIVGKLCEIPVGPKEHRRQIPIITDEYPDKNFGSGAVKITGAHDFNDYAVAKRGGIPLYRLMDTRGQMRADGAPYAAEAGKAQDYARGRAFTENEIDVINLVPDHLRGLDRFEARAKVVDEITSEGLAVMTVASDPRLGTTALKPGAEGADAIVPLVEAKPIMQPFGDRSKVVIEPMLTDQWFVDAEKVVGPALDAVRDGTVKIIPESGEKTYYHWLENIEPWCISRQLWWGHQIPVWYGPNRDDLGASYKAFCAASEQDALLLAQNYYGANVEVDFDSGPEELSGGIAFGTIEGPGGQKTLQSVSLTRDPDVLDTWFSSGLWPIGTLGWPEDTDEMRRYFPTSVLITGFDILFFWVARMMMMQLAVVDQVPFHTVYLHQLVRDEKGKKMSKTTGNVIDPLEIVDEFGADALRFTNASMAAIGGVLKLSKERITGYRNFTTKLWNAIRFAEMNEVFTDAVPQLSAAELAPKAAVNRWIIGETARVREEVDAALDSYRFNDAANALYAFVWGKVCDWYVELSKPLLQGEDTEAQAETRATMRWVMDQCLVLLHPIMPFITEELWGLTAERAKMLVHADWPTYKAADLVDDAADREMNWVISVIENTRSARAQMRVPAGLYVPMIVTEIDDHGQAAWDRNEALIKRLARIDSLTKADAMPKGCISIAAPGAAFGLPLAEIIDIGAEKDRLEKAKGKLAKELGGLRGRLNNPKFVESAPDEVVEEARENLAAREEEEARLNEALARLAELG